MPYRSATARASWSGVTTPFSSRVWPVVRPVSRASTTARSTASRLAKPWSTMMSPIRRRACGAAGAWDAAGAVP